jgi:hypothetical protein
VKITLCMYKSYFACRNRSCTCWNHSRGVSQLHLCVSKLHWVLKLHSTWRNLTMDVEIAFCVYTSHYACRNHSSSCWNHICDCRNYICACQNHTACRSYTQRVEISLCVYKSQSCALKSHFACAHHPWVADLFFAFLGGKLPPWIRACAVSPQKIIQISGQSQISIQTQ